MERDLSIQIFISSLNLYKGGSLRTDCPVCEHFNTLSVTDFNDCIKYNCFYADCDVRGVVTKELSHDSFKLSSNKLPNTPVNFTSTLRRNNFPYEALRYLERVNCYEAFIDKQADIRYDYKQNRVVFCVTDKEGITVDAAGRAVKTDIKPKWFRYASARVPFICGTSKHGVIVEDCASATRIGKLVTGISLLGTYLFEGALNFLENYDKITIALDHDATIKAFDMIRDIKWRVEDVNMVVLETDLKNLSDEKDVRRILQL